MRLWDEHKSGNDDFQVTVKQSQTILISGDSIESEIHIETTGHYTNAR